MMLTHEQAAATWCPMARITAATKAGDVPSGQTVFNRVETDGKGGWPAGSNCVADQCAMWRWGETKRETKEQVIEVRIARLNGVTTEKRVEQVPVEVPHRGYCGLAGEPVFRGSAA
jgi:hypothetical protein